MSVLEVWLDVDFLADKIKIGTLTHDRGSVHFQYDAAWLTHPQRFDIDPDFSLHKSAFHPRPESGNFGIFLDSSPDRWGQTLMKRREALESRDQNRQARNLYAWDFLIGVQDATRQGALRFKIAETDTFLGDHKFAAPPLTSLGELEAVAKALSSKRIDDLEALRRWLSVLVAPGASLGGARPKANFTERDGSLWIGKFPAKDDDRDIGLGEMLAHQLSEAAGVIVPPAHVIRLSGGYHTFCVKRFDREAGRRLFYASAMTMLKESESEGRSYLDIANFITTSGAKDHIAEDLEQLFRRVVINMAVGNRDDHLRNHGFILAKEGWRLAPAFDVNPNIDKADHVLNLDDRDNRPNLGNIIATADFYNLPESRATQIADEITGIVSRWRAVAKRLGIANADIELLASAFFTDAQLPPIPPVG